MGLGKTVITIALILANPAPLEPAAGSNATEIAAQPILSTESPFRDPDLFERKSVANQKRGSIVSRGTLVVVSSSLESTVYIFCNESLTSMLFLMLLRRCPVPRVACGSMDR